MTKTGRLVVSATIMDRYAQEELPYVRESCLRDIAYKTFESLTENQPTCIRLRSHLYRDAMPRSQVLTLDVEMMPVETMQLVMYEHKLVVREIEVTDPVPQMPEPRPLMPAMLATAWARWTKYVDETRASLGG